MGHFAEINENNIVVRVLITDSNDPAGDEGHSWLVNTLGGTWVRTSYNATIRKHYAGIGFTYSENLDAFIPPKVYDSWVLNEDTALWEAPIRMPQDAKQHPEDDGKIYVWNESIANWVEIKEKI